ncbi:MAG: HPF/RaiA family ribosome-associated protein [Gammaproteobacteria bacterium]|nr:HPF/RaiA family ribosome-associated protein [Gammaproteobacteria bacterium]
MQLDIQSRGFSLSEALTAYVKRRLISAVSAHDHHIQNIRVRLSDINGPRGGVDKCCLVHIELARKAAVTVRETSADMYAAIDMASIRLGHSVGRRLQKTRSPKRLAKARQALPFNKHTYAA